MFDVEYLTDQQGNYAGRIMRRRNKPRSEFPGDVETLKKDLAQEEWENLNTDLAEIRRKANVRLK